VTGLPPWVLADPFAFAAYLRDLFDLHSDTPAAPTRLPPKNAYIAGRTTGIAQVLMLLELDDLERFAERVETLFVDEIALHAEGYRAALDTVEEEAER
jgi:hypothetical protein